jgi:N-formylglutamate amidohydrolase
MDLPHSNIAAATGPVRLWQPVHQSVPVVFASAHSGRDYPQAFIDSARLDALRLRRSEDSFVDELFACAPAEGIPLVAATFPRAYCDANREQWELDPAMFADVLPSWVNTSSPRVGVGLGTIAKVVASGETIYRDKLRFAEVRDRIGSCWEPFHAELRAQVAATREAFGACLLIDCHSMPGTGSGMGPTGRDVVDIVLGDVHGTSCDPHVVRAIEQIIINAGFSMRRNDPYAGGYITRHYGRPREGVHALQIELNRALYMNEARIERSPQFGEVKARLAAMVVLLAERAPALILR